MASTTKGPANQKEPDSPRKCKSRDHVTSTQIWWWEPIGFLEEKSTWWEKVRTHVLWGKLGQNTHVLWGQLGQKIWGKLGQNTHVSRGKLGQNISVSQGKLGHNTHVLRKTRSEYTCVLRKTRSEYTSALRKTWPVKSTEFPRSNLSVQSVPPPTPAPPMFRRVVLLGVWFFWFHPKLCPVFKNQLRVLTLLFKPRRNISFWNHDDFGKRHLIAIMHCFSCSKLLDYFELKHFVCLTQLSSNQIISISSESI